MARFFVYEEYGASYESMLYDMNLTSKNIPNWQAYERGIEALANTLAPDNSREDGNRKGLTFGDLLIKVQSFLPRTFSESYTDDRKAHPESLQIPFVVRRSFQESSSD